MAQKKVVYREHVREVRQNVSLGPHGKLTVDEYVAVDFGKSNQLVFYRHIPTLYKRAGKICSYEVYVKGVHDEAGKALPFRSRQIQSYESIIIGDARTPLNGLHQFKLDYDLINGVNFVSGKPELFYSALGPEWTSPIDHLTLNVNVGANQNGLLKHAVAYIGSIGAKKHARLAQTSDGLQIACEKIPSGQDVILVAPLPAGSIMQTALPDQFSDLFETSQFAFFLPAATFVFLIILWLLIGSDQRFGKAPSFKLGAVWQPPSELSAAELGTIIDESCDDKDILVTIFDLAERGYIAVRETPRHGLEGYGTKDYEFSQPPQPVKGELKAHEEFILNVIFVGRNKAYLSDMDGYFSDAFPTLRKQIQQGLTKDKYFARDPQADRDYFVMTGSFITACGAMIYAYSIFVTDIHKMASVGVIVAGALIFAASGVMPKRTRRGVAAVDQIHKFEHFILSADHRAIDAAYEQDNNVFYRLLPAAVVLGMGEYWASKFKHLILQPPFWYTSMEQLEGESSFDTESFVQQLLHCLKAVNGSALTKHKQKVTKKLT